MARSDLTGVRESGTESKFYLPGMPSPRAAPSRIERYVRVLLRQRGTYRVRIPHDSR